MNFSQSGQQQQIQDTELSQTLYTQSGNGSIGSYQKYTKSNNMQLNQLNPNCQNITSLAPSYYHDQGLIYKINIDDLKLIRQLQIEKWITKLDIKEDDDLLNQVIPIDNKKIYANSLMNLHEIQVQTDLQKWVNIIELQYIIKNYFYIRYFYFKNTESFNQGEHASTDFGILVKYKNQIVVLIGIIEQCLDQPYLYYPTFSKIIEDLQDFQNTDIFSQEMVGLEQSFSIFQGVLKQLFHLRIKGENSFEVNQKLFRYLNTNEVPSNVMMKFIKYLLQKECKIELYNQQYMNIFPIHYPQVKIYSDSLCENDDEYFQIETLKVHIIYETIKHKNTEIKNCYLIYKKPFLIESGKMSNEVIPLVCGKCKSTAMTSSVKFVIERYDANKQRIRICNSCFNKQK